VKKMALCGVVLLLVCGVFLAAQETDSQETNLKDAVKIEAYGKAIWAPFVYRGHGNVGELNHETNGNGPAYGSGSGPGWDNIAAAVGIRAFGSDRDNNYGFDLKLRAVPVAEGYTGEINMLGYDNTANLWARPFGNDILKIQMGLYQWDDLRGKVGGVGEVVGGYGGGEDALFQRVESDVFGALLVVKPPETVPAALKGFTLFGSFGVSGGLDLDLSKATSFAARSEKALKYIFSTPHAGIAYEHEAFGLARAQFIGGNYLWGNGEDWTARTTQYPWYGTSRKEHYWLPGRAREEAQIEAAVNITRFPGFNVDIGFGYGLPVTVVSDDSSDAAKQTGPRWGDLGYRGSLSWTAADRRMADAVGDVWQPPMHVAAAVDFKPKDLNFGLRFRAMAEFGEQVAFADGSDNFKRGLAFEVGLQPEYTIGKLGVVSLFGAVRVKQNDSYNGKSLDSDSEVTIASLTHNGSIDLGLGAFFTRQFSGNSYIKAGVSATLPIGGDRYNWSTDDIAGSTGWFFTSDGTEKFKQGNFIITVPIILEVNL